MQVIFRHEIKPSDTVNENHIVQLLLKSRGIHNQDQFLSPKRPESIHLVDFGFKREWLKTAKLLQKIKNDKGMIVVYSDYDADGITGAAILWETLHLIGFRVMPYVPHRKREGYGFSTKGIDVVKRKFRPALIISVDHGITAAEKIAYAKSLGIPIIVTDHHVKPEKGPKDAFAIFHIPALSGSGVAYYFAKQVFELFKPKLPLNTQKHLEDHFKTEYPILAAIGTIADLVPLIGPSRSIVKYGLEAAIHTKRIGLRQILKQAGIERRKITPFEVGFIIAPRINAIGRLEHAIDALRLLCTTDTRRAEQLADKIGNKNEERQDMVKKAVEEAKKKVPDPLPKCIILQSDQWHEGIIGLIASKIAEEYYRPTIVITKSDGYYKGSARSTRSFHITNFLTSLKEYLVDVGGHAGAAGFTIEKKNLKSFKESAQKRAGKLIAVRDLERTYEADIKIPLSRHTMRLVKYLEVLEPFGIGNIQPTFLSYVKIIDARPVGKTGNHLKILAVDHQKHSFPIEFMYFGKGKLIDEFTQGTVLTLLYSLEINRWNGQEKLSGRIITVAV